jgi:hypothetical protein
MVTLCLELGLGGWRIFLCVLPHAQVPVHLRRRVTSYTLAPPWAIDCCCLLLSACWVWWRAAGILWSRSSLNLQQAQCWWPLGRGFFRLLIFFFCGMDLLLAWRRGCSVVWCRILELRTIPGLPSWVEILVVFSLFQRHNGCLPGHFLPACTLWGSSSPQLCSSLSWEHSQRYVAKGMWIECKPYTYLSPGYSVILALQFYFTCLLFSQALPQWGPGWGWVWKWELTLLGF